MSDYPPQADFASHLGSDFEIAVAPDASITAKLKHVSEVRSRPPQEQFSIVFLAPKESELPQGVYDVSHTELGNMLLFLVPVAQTDNGLELEAVFSNLTE